MLSISLISLLIAVPLFSYRITPSLFNRITCITLFYAAYLSLNSLYVENIAGGVGVYSGMFHVTNISLGMEAFLFCVGALILLGWANSTNSEQREVMITSTAKPTVNEHSLMILFTTIGASLLVSSSDLVSMFLSIELQSFAVYILATLYRDSESATAAGLKYFLLGGLSSALILLGTALIYSFTGLTQFESIYSLVSVTDSVENRSLVEGSGITGQVSMEQALIFGMVLIGIGFLFKVASAPFHNWAPDVYDGTPTVVTAWLSTMPKISIFAFLLEIQSGLEGSIEHLSLLLNSDGELLAVDVWKNLLLMGSLLSLLLGTVLGLSQYRIKRLLTYSTISHVGFLLLALAINTEESVESFLFYLMQYSLTNINVFLVLLAFGYILHSSSVKSSRDIQFIQELKGEFQKNPLLSFSFALCLFSMAGIPPLIGFFAKQMVLYSSTHAGYYFMSIVAILVSVISASYYLKIIQVMYFGAPTLQSSAGTETEDSVKNSITNVHSFLIATLTVFITLFMLQPTILLNSCHLLALSLFYY